jgi:hypothetical protein
MYLILHEKLKRVIYLKKIFFLQNESLILKQVQDYFFFLQKKNSMDFVNQDIINTMYEQPVKV